jgi:hypothetical protein
MKRGESYRSRVRPHASHAKNEQAARGVAVRCGQAAFVYELAVLNDYPTDWAMMPAGLASQQNRTKTWHEEILHKQWAGYATGVGHKGTATKRARFEKWIETGRSERQIFYSGAWRYVASGMMPKPTVPSKTVDKRMLNWAL